VLAWNLGARFDVSTTLGPVLVGAAALVAYAYYRDGQR
jgi:hypothetical protein